MAGARLLSSAVALLLFCCSFSVISSASVNYDYYNDNSNSYNSSNMNMSAICGLVPNGVYVADTNNCGYYYSCNNGVATIQYCYNNYYFSKDAQQCLPQNQVNCISNSNENPCLGRTVGSWVSVPGNCNSYYYCGNTGPQQGYCPTGENFNPYAQQCQYPTNYPCTNYGTGDSTDGSDGSVNLCNYVENGIYFGSPSSCQGWNYCQNNAITSGNCPSGYYYNVQRSSCLYATVTTCSQLSSDPGLANNNPYYGGACSSASPSTKASTTCESYYLCNGANYTLTWCPNNLYYDTVSASCVNRVNARNNCDRCQGTSDTFVNTYSTTSCTGYSYCQNNIAQYSGNCPSGAYFNEVDGACVMGVDPNFGCCNPSYYDDTAATTDAPA